MREARVRRSITQEQIEKYIVDEDDIFTTDNGLKAAIFGTYVKVDDEQEILMYIGEGTEGYLRDRVSELAYYWLLNSRFYCGIESDELREGYKFKVKILSEEQDEDKRYSLKQYLIETMRPYIQSGPYPKYETPDHYRGFDLAIFPTYRRRAFLFARDGALPFEEIIKKEKSPMVNVMEEVQ